jgi:hypothetical protein
MKDENQVATCNRIPVPMTVLLVCLQHPSFASVFLCRPDNDLLILAGIIVVVLGLL